MPNDEVQGAVDARAAHRFPVLGVLLAVLLAVAGSLLFVRVADPFNPYRSGTTHTVSLVDSNPDCLDGWSVQIDDGPRHYTYAQGVAPDDWKPGPVTGTLHILSSWGGDGTDAFNATDAVFEARGQNVNLTGGRQDGKHFFLASCAVR
jgi:hypothetical protein